MRHRYWWPVMLALMFGITQVGVNQAEAVTRIQFLAEETGGIAVVLERQVAEFNRTHPDIQVELILFSGEPTAYEARILAGAAAGTLADVFTTHDNTTGLYQSRGLIAPAPGWFAEYIMEAMAKNLRDAIEQEVVFDGRVFGSPWDVDWVATWYNVDMFEEAGLSGAPRNWDELISYSQKLVKYDDKGQIERSGFSLRVSGHPSGILDKFFTFLTAAGGDVFVVDGSGNLGVAVDSAAMREAIQLYLDLMYEYRVDAPGIPRDTDAFEQGLTAMYHREAGVAQRLQRNAPNLRFASAPTPDHTHPSRNRAFVDTVVVYSRSRNQDAAWQFIRWLMEPEREAERAESDYLIPVLEKSMSIGSFTENPYIGAWLNEGVYLPPSDPRVYELETVIGRYLERIFLRQMTVDQGLAAAQREAEQVLRR